MKSRHSNASSLCMDQELNSCVEDLFCAGEKSCSLTSKLILVAEVSMAALFYYSTGINKFNMAFSWYWLNGVHS